MTEEHILDPEEIIKFGAVHEYDVVSSKCKCEKIGEWTYDNNTFDMWSHFDCYKHSKRKM